jgi:hypothetical protein
MQPLFDLLPWMMAGGAILVVAAFGLVLGGMLYGASGGGVFDAPSASGISRRAADTDARLRARYLRRRLQLRPADKLFHQRPVVMAREVDAGEEPGASETLAA